MRVACGPIVVLACVLGAAAVPTDAAPRVTRLNPPSRLFSHGEVQGPKTARFLPGQRFDLQATIAPDEGRAIVEVRFLVDDLPVAGAPALGPATTGDLPPGTVTAVSRAYSHGRPGVHTLAVEAVQDDGTRTVARGDFEVVALAGRGARARNAIFVIGDGMGVAHRTAARLVRHGVTQGKADALLAMDTFPHTALVRTHSLDSIVTDSSPGAACYSTGNKSANGQHGVFPDDTLDKFDNPRVEHLAEYLRRRAGKSLGIVTTADVTDATPSAFAGHTQDRDAGTGLADQYLDERASTGLAVLLGGGRRWFLPRSEPESARSADDGNDAVLPEELARGWAVPPGALDPQRDLLADFRAAGFRYVADAAMLAEVPAGTERLLGLFATGNMPVALDKVAARRAAARDGRTSEGGLADVPLLDEMVAAALAVLRRDRDGFVLLVEGASIDKQAHAMDTERWIVDTIELDRAVAVCRDFAWRERDTLVVVTADHECGGVNVIGASLLGDSELEARAAGAGGTGGLRDPVVGTYARAGFPRYAIAEDGYPRTTDPDRRILVGYAAAADRHEDWRTDGLTPRPVAHGPDAAGDPLEPEAAGGFFLTGHVPGSSAVHTASDVPLSAFGRGAARFGGVMDNTDVFFEAAAALLAGGERPNRP